MRRLSVAFAFALAGMIATAPFADAGPSEPNGHNCRGFFRATLQEPGTKSSRDAAHEGTQSQDARQAGAGAFGANCGDNSGGD